MNDITLFPADIAAMSVSQLAALPAAQKAEIDKNLDEALDWLKKARTKFDAALDAAYGEQARATLRDSETASFTSMKCSTWSPPATMWAAMSPSFF